MAKMGESEWMECIEKMTWNMIRDIKTKIGNTGKFGNKQQMKEDVVKGMKELQANYRQYFTQNNDVSPVVIPVPVEPVCVPVAPPRRKHKYKLRRIGSNDAVPNGPPILETSMSTETPSAPICNIVVDKLYRSKYQTLRCHQCNILFKNNQLFIAHFKTEHGVTEPYQCPECTKSFATRFQLTPHVRRVHLRERTYFCDVCGKGFFENHSLKRHYRYHTDERPFECEVCKRAFHSRNALNIHMRIHTGEKQFQCHVCERPFAHKRTLELHIINRHSIHSKRRLFGKWQDPKAPRVAKPYSTLHPFSR